MNQKSILSVYISMFTLITLLLLVVAQNNLLAQVPFVKTQAPGYFRMMVGDFEVTALCDGAIEMNTKIMHNATETELRDLLKHAYVDPDKIHTSVNAFLVNTGTKLVLIDAGAAKVFGPTLGSVIPNLIASGYKPEQVDAIFVTHMHGDHVGGLIDADGKPAYPNAVVYLSKAENDFWFSKEIFDKAPDAYKPHFTKVRKLVAPYMDANKLRTLANDEQPIPGIKIILTPGHTAGHVAYEVKSGSSSILFIGDMVHIMDVQFPRPDVSFDYDTDQKQAVATRLAEFKSFAENGTIIAGAHLPFPGIGRLSSNGAAGYVWVPVRY